MPLTGAGHCQGGFSRNPRSSGSFSFALCYAAVRKSGQFFTDLPGNQITILEIAFVRLDGTQLTESNEFFLAGDLYPSDYVSV